MSSTGKPDLQGTTVLVTRPVEQAQELVEAIHSAGGRAVAFPTIEIRPAPEPARLDGILAHAGQYDWWIFVSANAVRFGVPALRRSGVEAAQVSIAAVGAATAAALRAAGLEVAISPGDSSGSEALVEAPALLDLRGRRILIFRGEGGREWLRDVLQTRGAAVDYAECYTRGRPAANMDSLQEARGGRDIDVISVTSVEGLRNLLAMTGAATVDLRAIPLLVVGERQAQAARDLGWRAAVTIAPDAHTSSIVETLRAWRSLIPRGA